MDIPGGSVGLRYRPAIAPASPCAPLLQSKRWQAALTGIKDSSRSTKTFRVVMRLTGRRDGGNRDGPQEGHAKQHACLSNLCGQYVFFMIVNVAHACNSSKSRSSSGEPQALALHWTLGINKAGNNDLLKLKRHAESEREREIDRACALALVRTSLAACTTFQMQNLLTCSTPLLTRASSSTITPGWAILHCP